MSAASGRPAGTATIEHPDVEVPRAFESAGADHAAILCANTGCLRERRRTGCDRRTEQATGQRLDVLPTGSGPALLEVLADNLPSKRVTVRRHEKHPKGRIEIQLLGCSSERGVAGAARVLEYAVRLTGRNRSSRGLPA
ncbi:hypothetical protein [Burkholderia sp. BCC1644]|uniref:hypothetical protein n=1 Tax=Burkholderia sp. BCC1644 TaxID=2676293 RepID=UPI0015911F9F|nr:hypothetical protein [Burkholderia sp. BCC1644]